MNKTTWQQQLQNRAGQFKAWLADRANRDTPYLVYGGLMASTLWPVIVLLPTRPHRFPKPMRSLPSQTTGGQ